MSTNVNTNGENFSTRIKKLSEGKSLRAFAAELGISHAALSNYLKGRKPKILELQKISKATGKSVSWLLLGEERPGPLVFEGVVEEGDMVHLHLDLEEQEIVLEVKKLLAVGNQALTRDLRQQVEWVKKVHAAQIERRTQKSERAYRPPTKKRVVGFGQETE